MLPSVVVAKTTRQDGTEFCLVRRGEEWSIRIGGTVLMSSRQRASEEALAVEALKLLPDPQHVLVGGLGLGFTLSTVLARLPRSARVTVAELLPEVVEWNRSLLVSLNGRALLDPRCTVVIEDVYAVLKRSPNTFDVILLDVDNGPVALCDAGNQRLYGVGGLRTCFTALRPKGVISVWSAGQSNHFDQLLARVGFKVSSQRVPKASGSRARHVLHIGQRP